jgi:AraC-like DNA-binding protein
MVRVGFTDESHFVRYFKRLHRMTPSKYRRQNLVIDSNKKSKHSELKDSPTNSKTANEIFLPGSLSNPILLFRKEERVAH